MANPLSNTPTDWHDLQKQVATILTECGYFAENDKPIQTVRGDVKVDVYAKDNVDALATIYICECKHWANPVPKSVVHSFRTVIADSGANVGLIISSAGFQSGAYEAAQNSNVQLLNWTEFQDLFRDRWIKNFFLPRLWEENDALNDYTEPINSRISRKAGALSSEKLVEFMRLRNQYQVLSFFSLHLSIYGRSGLPVKIPDLPIKNGVIGDYKAIEGGLPADVCEAGSLRELYSAMAINMRQGTAEFDHVFGGRA